MMRRTRDAPDLDADLNLHCVPAASSVNAGTDVMALDPDDEDDEDQNEGGSKVARLQVRCCAVSYASAHGLDWVDVFPGECTCRPEQEGTEHYGWLELSTVQDSISQRYR